MFCLFPTEEGEGTQLANAVSNICRQIEKREQFLREIIEAEPENKELAWNWIWNSGFFCLSLILFQYFDILKGKLRKILVGSPSGERQKRARCVLSYSIFLRHFFRLISTLCSFAISIFIDIIFDLFLQSAPPLSSLWSRELRETDDILKTLFKMFKRKSNPVWMRIETVKQKIRYDSHLRLWQLGFYSQDSLPETDCINI